MIEIRDVAAAGPWPTCRAQLAEGEVLGILGPSGGGRTALLEAIAGARRHRGQVLVDGRLRRPVDIGVAPEEPEQILFGQTAGEAVRGEAGRAMLQALGGQDLSDRDWHTLSAGERRRVALATVLGLSRRLLLFDRPTAGLDPDGSARFWRALRARGTAAVVVVNDRGEAARCDQWLYLPAGGQARTAQGIVPYADGQRALWPPDERALVGWVLGGRSPRSDGELIEEVRRWRTAMGQPR